VFVVCFTSISARSNDRLDRGDHGDRMDGSTGRYAKKISKLCVSLHVVPFRSTHLSWLGGG